MHNFTDGLTGFFYFAWVIPYGIGCIIFVLVYLNFLKNLDVTTRWLFVISGLLFCLGAIGMEIIGSKIFTLRGQWSWEFAISSTIEETLEMVGISLFIYALIDYINRDSDYVKIDVLNEEKN